MNRIIKNITFLFLLLLTVGAVRAQVDDKGVTSTGKEVDCSTINPSVDQAVDQYGAIVTRPTLTRNGKLITRDCYCPFDLGDGNASITDFVYCTSVKMFAELSYRDPEARELPKNACVYVFTDAAYTHCVDTVEPAVIEHLEGKDTLTVDITGLSCYTRYYFRLVATNTTECVFDWTDSTRDVTMEKATTCDVLANLTNEHLYETGKIDSVYDHEHNAYAVVQIGNQCWLKENMRAVTEPGGGNILQNPASDKSITIQRAYYYNNDSANVVKYGCLYNWPAAMNGATAEGARGICPNGWHVPTDAEWTTLTTNAGVGAGTGTEAGSEAGKLAGGCDWTGTGTTTTPNSYSYTKRDSTGFSALPAGNYFDSFTDVNDLAAFWSATSEGSDNAYNRDLRSDRNYVYRYHYSRAFGFSVRCVRNTPDTITFISNNGVNDTMRQLAMRGATTQLLADTFTHGVGFEFASWNTDRNGCGTSYADEAEVTIDGNITLYAQWNTFCNVFTRNDDNEFGSSDGRIDTVADHQGNKYTVTTINGICVMKQNMRCTTSPSGQTLSQNSGDAYASSYFKINTNFGDEGYLYNWRAALDANNNVMNIIKEQALCRGICPDGWHIPTVSEWNSMIGSYDAGQFAAFNCTPSANWNSSNTANYPGNTSDPDKNFTGFSGLPVGYHSEASPFKDSNAIGYFCSATPCGSGSDANSVYNFHLAYNNGTFFKEKDYKRTKVSVRCMRNPEYAVVPTVDSVSCTSMNISAQVIGLGDLTAKTIKLYTDEDCTTGEVVGTVTADANTISANFTNLSCNTRYYIKVTATDGTHSVEGLISDSTRDLTMEKATYCTVASVRAWNGTDSDQSHEHLVEGSTTEIDSVYDHQGNRYAVVQIGNQCWLKENMRATTSPNGLLTNSTSTDPSVPFYYPTSNVTLENGTTFTPEQYKAHFGLLYSFAGTMDINTSATSFTYPHRGICPAGWHVPTAAEWTTLTTNANVGVGSGSGSGKLVGGCDWDGFGSTTTPNSYSYTERDSTGFSALPAGYLAGSAFNRGGKGASFWLSTPEDNVHAYSRYLFHTEEFVRTPSNNRYHAFSVRCVRDAQAKTYCSVDLKLDNENSSVDGRIDSVADHEGNWYKVVEIGDQCWLAENMRCTTEPNGTNILQKLHSGSSYSAPRAYYYGDDAANFAKYGCLYNFPGAMSINDQGTSFTYPHRGICPEGWHVPTDDEWTTLTSSAQVGVGSGTGAGKLAGGSDWYNTGTTTTPNSYSYADRNVTGFSALPAGDYTGSNFGSVREHAYFWSATPDGIDNAYNRYFYCNIEYVYRSKRNRGYGFSVRCVRNTPASATISFHANGGTGSMTAMSVTTMTTDTVLDANTFTHDGNWAFRGWNTKMDGTGTAYDDQAHITPTESITLYAQWHTWCDASSVRAQSGTDLSHEHAYNNATDKIDSVYDHEGNAYAVVQIGNQCWLKENMRATTLPGTNASILKNSSAGTDAADPRAYYYSDSETNYAKYGCLYNFSAAMNIAAQSTTFTYPHRGICPEGWHVPQQTEWDVMVVAAGCTHASGNGTGVGKLVGGNDWSTYTAKLTAAGNNTYSERDSSGFTVLPAGSILNSTFSGINQYAYFWTSTPNGGGQAYRRHIYYLNENVTAASTERARGQSVRCVRDAQAKNYCSVDLKLDNENSSVAGRIDSVADHEGNWYKVVEIGNQCWLAENMRATTEPTDPTISIVFNSSVGSSSTEPRAFYYLNNEANYAKYGALYNFPATMNYTGDLPAFVHPHRGICPEGWHVPEDAEWTTMERTVAPEATNLHNNFNADCLVVYSDFQASDTPLAVELSGGTDWQNSSNEKGPGYYYNTLRNITGFSALPAGDYRNNFYDINEATYFMSSTTWLRPGVNDNLVICRGLYHAYSGMNRNAYNIENHYSVRCVRNTPAPATISFHANGGSGTMTAMSVTTMRDTVLDANTFTHDGNWAFRGWNTKMDGTGTAYADGAHIVPTESITLYAQWHTWCDGNALSNNELGSENGRVDSVKDHQDNWYKVVQIGGQCWLKENMRATTNLSGTSILKNSSEGTSTSEPRAYYYNDNNSNLRKYGCLYNFLAAYSICPNGWHLPISTDWILLASSAQVELLYQERNYTNYTNGLGKLTGGCDWAGNYIDTYPNNYTYSDRNCTGFTAIPAGYLFDTDSGFQSRNEVTNFWGVFERWSSRLSF